MNSLKLHRASPEAFYAALDRKLGELESRLDEYVSRVDSLSYLGDRFLTSSLIGTVAGPALPTSWTYLAELPNPIFADIYPPEKNGSRAKRWVGRSGRIGARLGLPRTLQYNFMIHIVDFIAPEVRSSFRLTVNGDDYPWLDTADDVFRTMVLDSTTASAFEFELTIDPGTIPDGNDVSFSFSSISVERRG